MSFRFYSDIPKHFSIAIRILEKSVTVKQLIQPIIKKSKKEGINEERKKGLDHCSVQIIMTDFLLWKRVIMISPFRKGEGIVIHRSGRNDDQGRKKYKMGKTDRCLC